MPKTLPAMLANLFLVGVVTIIFVLYGEMNIWIASTLATAVWLMTILVFKGLMRWGGGPGVVTPTGWEGLDLDQHFHRERLQGLFNQYEVTGSMNVRNGHIFAVVNPDLLSPLAKRLRACVALIKMHPKAGADLFYMEGGVVGLADLTVMEIEQAASVIEREVEDRNSSRKLYRGFGEEEIVSMARTVVADYIRNAQIEGDNIILSNSIRKGEQDGHPMMLIAVKTIRFILQIKGTNL